MCWTPNANELERMLIRRSVMVNIHWVNEKFEVWFRPLSQNLIVWVLNWNDFYTCQYQPLSLRVVGSKLSTSFWRLRDLHQKPTCRLIKHHSAPWLCLWIGSRYFHFGPVVENLINAILSSSSNTWLNPDQFFSEVHYILLRLIQHLFQLLFASKSTQIIRSTNDSGQYIL